MKPIYVIIIGLTFVLTSCRDTCNKKYGSTFENVNLDELSYTNNKLHINFNVSALNDLPNDYFQNYIQLDTDSIFVEIDTVMMNKTALEIVIEETNLPILNESSNLFLSLQFDDRRSYLDCAHPGQNDRYILEISGSIRNNSNSSYSFTNFEWNQYTDMGAI